MAGPEDLNGSNNALKSIKLYFETLTETRKRLVILAICALVLVAGGLTYYLNTRNTGYKVLYSGLDAQEAIEVRTALQELGVPSQIDGRGQVYWK